MTEDEPKSLTKRFDPLLRWSKAVVSFGISQFEATSTRHAAHLMRQASVEVWRDALKGTNHALNSAKGKLLDRLASTSDTSERVRLLHDLEFIDQRLNLAGVIQSSLPYLPSNQESVGECEASDISPHWMDKFAELAKARNEDWRANLLARAFAVETATPGTISPRVLWTIGTLEQRTHEIFVEALQHCILVDSQYFIPGSDAILEPRIRELLAELSDTSFFPEVFTSALTITTGVHDVCCGSQRLRFHVPTTQSYGGLPLTSLGQKVSVLFPVEPTDFAYSKLGLMRTLLLQSGCSLVGEASLPKGTAVPTVFKEPSDGPPVWK